MSVHELAVAVLMTFKAFANEQHIKRSFGVFNTPFCYFLFYSRVCCTRLLTVFP